MNIREKILVVEDEKSISRFISTILNTNGYEAMQARSGQEALSMIASHCPDLIILDLGLPDMDGMDILRQLRSWTSLPVVVVSARSHEGDKVSALDLGADDYLTKPFGTDELLARVRAAIRPPRTVSGNDEIAQKGTYTVGDLVVDFTARRVTIAGEALDLSPKEYDLLFYMVRNRGIALTREKLISEVWGYDFFGDSRTVDVHVKRLRDKLVGSEEMGWALKTVWGVGYKFEVK